jgi:predicted RNA binding protein YcfA (HicA-like mRNA interferase family)
MDTEVSVPSNVRFAEVRKLLELNGWTLARIRGSHHVFTKPGLGSLPIPVHRNQVKAAYVRKIQKILSEEK